MLILLTLLLFPLNFKKALCGQIELDWGITPGLLVKWRNKYQVISAGADQTRLELNDFEAAKREIRRLERRLAEVEEDREI